MKERASRWKQTGLEASQTPERIPKEEEQKYRIMVVTSSHRVSDPSQLTDGEGDPAPLLVAPKPLKESPVRQAIEHLKSATKKRDEEHAAGKIT